VEYSRQLFGFTDLPPDQRFGILPKGCILCSPCAGRSRFYIQLIEPEAGILDVEDDECLQRIGLGCTGVLAAVGGLSKRGVVEKKFRPGLDPIDIHASISALTFSTFRISTPLV